MSSRPAPAAHEPSPEEAELSAEQLAPQRLLAGGGSAFERRLLEASLTQRLPEAALQRVARRLNTPLHPVVGAAAQGQPAAKATSRWAKLGSAGVLGGLGLVAPIVAS